MRVPLLVIVLCAFVLAGCGDDRGSSTSAGSSGSTNTGRGTVEVTAVPETTTGTSTTSTTEAAADEVKHFVVIVDKGAVEGSPGLWEVEQGDKVDLEVRSNVADEMHLHGYDKKVDVEAGKPAHMRFTATLTGGFEAEFESSHLPLGTLQVNP